MWHTVTILTLSEKWGKKCVVAFDHQDNRLIRLVSRKENGEGIPKENLYGISLLDIVSVNIKNLCPLEHQTENVLMDSQYGFQKTGFRNEIQKFHPIVNRGNYVFRDNQYKLQTADFLKHSIELVRFHTMKIEKNQYGKTVASFYIKDVFHRYYRVTDHRFFDITGEIPAGYAVISLPPSDKFTQEGGGFFKYISAIYTI